MPIRTGWSLAALLLLPASLGLIAPLPAVADPVHALAMHGEPALPADFDHLAFADPNAPKGGTITFAFVGTYDSLNPFIVKGAETTARGIWDVSLGNNVFEALMTRNRDEPFTLYGLLAESVEVPDDRSSVLFNINPKAHFSDGTPVTQDDVIFSLNILREKGRPNYRSWYSKVKQIDKVGDHGVKFTFADGKDRELPMLLGLMPVLPKHAIDPETFDQSTLKPLIGSGPYVMDEIKPGERFTLKRDPNYWGKDLPIKRGFDNFDEIRVEYYRDRSAMFEAFKKGLYDVNPEADPANWQNGYDFPAVRDGKVVKETIPTGTPKGMLGFAFNTRRPIFEDVRVRKALSMLFDFEWLNKNLFFGVYKRNASYFEDSILSSVGIPADDREKALLAPFPGAVEPAVLDGTYRPVQSDGSGSDRNVLRSALSLLGEAGYKLNGNTLLKTDGNTPLQFEILLMNREQERVALAFTRTLARIGIKATVRTVDSAQYQRRVQEFDFDMIMTSLPASLSPGNEQNFRWSSAQADVQGSYNYTGAKSPAIDAMLDALLAARSQEDFVAAVHALDRILISGYYFVPLYYLPDQWVARWTRVDHPKTQSLYGYTLGTWYAAP
ncbi:extracellular solute-binding protein [Kaistia dalseonensis]|uniref:Peptide/nickel transport system substrate-binding protein n=1 Tax=Kaistia dalseonensis TaxID=410840 RepID=A0ABU0H2K5_9HYPH|nr:extracellular solute-binding protein [Kaistia dalseonensis]MCX5493957.1 extracellular solute-binding protein [Kaistia dalseonensis]MDQ0436533.1 peptide/nickel transport system substrate-binding protein [Kaistia dalseonensis]